MPPLTKTTRGPKRRRVGYEARRELIVKAAMESFAEVGYEAASLDEIARRAGITKAVLYDHFESKAKLHLHLLKRERDQLLAHIKERLEAVGTDAAGVAVALDTFFGWVESHPYAWRMLFRETAGDAKVARAHGRIQAQAHRAIVDILLSGHEQELPRKMPTDVTKEALGALIGGAANGLARWWYDNRSVPREQLVSMTMDVLWLGLERARAGGHWDAR